MINIYTSCCDGGTHTALKKKRESQDMGIVDFELEKYKREVELNRSMALKKNSGT